MTQVAAAMKRFEGATSCLVLVPPGKDRLRTGRELVAAVVEEGPDGQRLVLQGGHPDVIELSPPPGKEKVGIAQVREVIRQGQFTPVRGRRKVCLIEEAEGLTLEAANALLKVLEEPPRDLVFVLLAEHSGSLLPTIVSRSRVIRLGGLEVTERLRKTIAAGYSESEARFLGGVARHPAELTRYLDCPEDFVALRRRARDLVQAGQGSVVESVDRACDEDPLVRHEGILALLGRLITEGGVTAVAAARDVAGRGREATQRFLEDLLHVVYGLVAARHGRGTAILLGIVEFPLEARPSDEARLRGFVRHVDWAARAVDRYAPREAVLWSVCLAARRLQDG